MSEYVLQHIVCVGAENVSQTQAVPSTSLGPPVCNTYSRGFREMPRRPKGRRCLGISSPPSRLAAPNDLASGEATGQEASDRWKVSLTSGLAKATVLSPVGLDSLKKSVYRCRVCAVHCQQIVHETSKWPSGATRSLSGIWCGGNPLASIKPR